MAPQQQQQPAQVKQETGFSGSGPASGAREAQAQDQSSQALRRTFSELLEPLRALLEKYGAMDADGKFICSDAEAAHIKINMAAVLNLPAHGASIAINYDPKTGNAITRNEAGEEIMKGLVTLDRSTYARLPFEYNISTGALTLDGKPALRQEIPAYCSKITTASLMAPLGTIAERESSKLDEGYSLKAEDGKIVLLTASMNYSGTSFTYAKYFHCYIGTEKMMYPVQIKSAERFRDGGSTYVNGSFTDENGQEHSVNLSLPFREEYSLKIDGDTQGLDFIKASAD